MDTTPGQVINFQYKNEDRMAFVLNVYQGKAHCLDLDVLPADEFRLILREAREGGDFGDAPTFYERVVATHAKGAYRTFRLELMQELVEEMRACAV